MFDLGIPLSDLERKSDELTSSMDDKIAQLERTMPQLKVREYMETLAEDFVEMPFMPLGEVWERELGDLFKDMED